MTRLPNIKLTEEEVQKMLLIDGRRYGEAFICTPPGDKTLYKIFCKDDSLDDIIDDDITRYPEYISTTKDILTMPDNKLKKLEKLFKLQLENSVIPLSTLSMNGELIGYEMTRDFNDIALNPPFLRRKELIHFLEQAKNILEYFASKDIIYGDVANRNILINRKTKTVKFCDMDNICLGSFPIDKMSWELASYYEERGALDNTADAYMHNLMTILDFGINPHQEITANRAFNRFFKPDAAPLLQAIENPQSFTGEYIIQYIKK